MFFTQIRDEPENLAKICSPELMRRIEVVNLDRWVAGFLRKNGYAFDIDYGQRTRPLWEKALSLAPSELDLKDDFYRQEWDRVIQPQDISSFSDYLKAKRVGRGIRLTRPQRKAVWPVFEEYRLLLNENSLREVDDALRDARAMIQAKGDILPYRAIVVDEAQDISVPAFKLLRRMIAGGPQPNDLFIVGDAHQRIYRHKVVLGHCGINIKGRGRRLKINYRTTEENRRWAVSLLKGLDFDDLDGGLDDQQGYKSLIHGVDPTVKQADTFPDEIAMITQYIDQIEKQHGSLKDICLVARTHDLLKQYANTLDGKGKPCYLIRPNEAEDRRKPGIRLATMHRVKGLEFDHIIIAGVNDGIVPIRSEWSQTDDTVVQREIDTQERALLYVAATRAKKEVIVTSFGKPSPFLTNL